MYTLDSVGVKKIALISFIVGFVITGVFFLPFAFFSFLFTNGALNNPPKPDAFPFHIFKYFFFFGPFLYGIMGAIMNSMIAIAYNIVAKKVGGIKISVTRIIENEN